ncbi:methyltransferase domain-containing protein [Actinoplanes sp. KI2]|uniref:class I SAM-dependent methyltransferase n=1 Tax=Actinoplanes sp. KI2 TaxID=2983315 RepID=UPI0021D5819A|nr:methyltransferase domain-containing protein [Actinoplanes sp. KI2]MCU7730039.1 methyltransferase domain-containing protein [Actinoplanes sp. KI2]
MSTDIVETATDPIEALSGRLFAAGVEALELCNVYLGVQLGLYAALDGRPATPAELAARTGLARRYLGEWLQQQAVAGLLVPDGDDPAAARYTLADGVAAVLTEPTGPAYLGGLPFAVAAVGRVLPDLARAFRTGDAVPYAAYGPDALSAQSALNRPAYVNLLIADWLPRIPAVHARLADTGRPARVGDFGCGPGWSTIELAKAFPHLRLEGYDSDEASIAAARRNAAEHGVADRVGFEVVDLADEGADWSPRHDVSFLFECLHDVPRPVESLAHVRRALAPGGTVVVMDERTADTFTAPGDPVERFFAAAGTLWCIPQGMVGADPEPAGPLMRATTLREFAARAGFGDCEVLDIDHPFWRFYRLVP